MKHFRDLCIQPQLCSQVATDRRRGREGEPTARHSSVALSCSGLHDLDVFMREAIELIYKIVDFVL